MYNNHERTVHLKLATLDPCSVAFVINVHFIEVDFE